MPEHLSISSAIRGHIFKGADPTRLAENLIEVGLIIANPQQIKSLKEVQVSRVGMLVNDHHDGQQAQKVLLAIIESKHIRRRNIRRSALIHLLGTHPDQLITQAHRPLASIAAGVHHRFQRNLQEHQQLISIVIDSILTQVAKHNKDLHSFLSEGVNAVRV